MNLIKNHFIYLCEKYKCQKHETEHNHASREKKRRAAAFDCVDSAGVSRGLRFLTARFIRDVSSRNQTDADQDDEVGSQGKDPPCFRGFEEIK